MFKGLSGDRYGDERIIYAIEKAEKPDQSFACKTQETSL
jgi:hypothetical protein